MEMDKLWLYLFCFFNLIFLNYAAEYDEGFFKNRQAYKVTLFLNGSSRLQNSSSFNEENLSSLIYSQLRIDPNVQFQLTGQQDSKCLADIIYTLQNFRQEWALRMFDSYGKLESGIIEGNINWIGDYNECIQIHSSNGNSSVGNFNGKYCSVSLPLSFSNSSARISLRYGICVPDSCSTIEVQKYLKFSYVTGNATALNDVGSMLNATIVCKPTERHLNTPAKAVIALLSVFCSLAILGSTVTAVKYLKEVNNVKGHLDKLQTFLGCFCVFTNGAKILNTDSSSEQLLCLHGIRFLSMSWILLGHVYGYSDAETRNLAEVAQHVDQFTFRIILKFYYAVDSFFVLSGFLLAYLTMKELDKTKGSISWFYFYIHRYLRLTPIYMFVLGFYATVYLYIGDGPFWPDGDFNPVCRESWWYHLLYINNFIDYNKQCISWTWYLAANMQFFIISPLFLISLWRWPKIGYVLLASALCACCLSNFFITYHYGLMTEVMGNACFRHATDSAEANLLVNKVYDKPYTRIGPFLIGMLLGYLLFKNNTTQKRHFSWVRLSIGWTISTTITLACVFGLYNSHPSVLAGNFYDALHRTTFALGLAWVIYICLSGQGGFVNSILSFKLYIPLSRLTYTAYLIHPIILHAYYLSLKTTLESNHPTMVVIFLGIMVVTYGLSLPVALILEYPFIALEKFITQTFGKKEIK